jgi:hypothetical protein
VGKKGVSVTGEKDVFVGRLVSTRVAGTGVEVGVQAKELIIHRMKKKNLRFIREFRSPVRMIYPNDKEGISSYGQINIPVLERGYLFILWV